jgi:plasmid stabilization system protein ParE
MNVLVTRSAFKDLAQIWGYIAADSIETADRILGEIRAAIRKLAHNPGMGHRRTDVANPRYRFWSVYSYLIAYRVQGRTLYVARVIHGARDVGSVLSSGRR